MAAEIFPVSPGQGAEPHLAQGLLLRPDDDPQTRGAVQIFPRKLRLRLCHDLWAAGRLLAADEPVEEGGHPPTGRAERHDRRLRLLQAVEAAVRQVLTRVAPRNDPAESETLSGFLVSQINYGIIF